MKMVEEHYNIRIAPSTNEDVFCEEVKDADAMIVSSSAITRKIIESGNRLKVIGRHGIEEFQGRFQGHNTKLLTILE
jgi:D-3-phosphoglycerate dehydrogenase